MAAVELASLSLYGDASLTNYWKLENTTATIGGNNLSNPTGKSFVAAKFSNGVDMGSSIRNTLELNSTASIFPAPTAAYAISIWFKMNLALSGSNLDPGLVTASRDNATGFAFQITPEWNSGSPRIRVMRRTNTDVSQSVSFGNDTTLWHNVIHSYDGSNMTNYLDGVAFGSAVASSGSFNSSAYPNISIGGSYMSGNATAILDDCAVFTRALTAAEAALIYNGPAFRGAIAAFF